MSCLLQVNTGNWCQESYETSSRYAAKRARQLRKMGFVVTVSGMGLQVTSVGRVKLTMIDIRPGQNQDTFYLPKS
jgi:hypothetical protein